MFVIITNYKKKTRFLIDGWLCFALLFKHNSLIVSSFASHDPIRVFVGNRAWGRVGVGDTAPTSLRVSMKKLQKVSFNV